jgi:hypothetical protein
VQIAPDREDGGRGRATLIWVIRVGDLSSGVTPARRGAASVVEPTSLP